MRHLTRDNFDPSEVLSEIAADSIYDEAEVRRLLEECCHAPHRKDATLQRLIMRVGSACADATDNQYHLSIWRNLDHLPMPNLRDHMADGSDPRHGPQRAMPLLCQGRAGDHPSQGRGVGTGAGANRPTQLRL